MQRDRNLECRRERRRHLKSFTPEKYAEGVAHSKRSGHRASGAPWINVSRQMVSNPARVPHRKCRVEPLQGSCFEFTNLSQGAREYTATLGWVVERLRRSGELRRAFPLRPTQTCTERRPQRFQLAGRAELLVLVRDVVGVGGHERLARRARDRSRPACRGRSRDRRRTRPGGRRCRCSPWSRPAWRPAGTALRCTPLVAGSLPPASLMRSTHSLGTLLEPCMTSGKPGSSFWIASMRSKCSPCLPLNL